MSLDTSFCELSGFWTNDDWFDGEVLREYGEHVVYVLVIKDPPVCKLQGCQLNNLLGLLFRKLGLSLDA